MVAGRMMWGLGRGDLDMTAHVVGVCGLAGLEGRVKPVLGDGRVGVDEREEVAVGVSDAGVAGRVGGLDLAFVDESDPIVVVRADNVGRAISGVVVDDDNSVVARGLLCEKRVKRGPDTVRVVVDGDDDGYSSVF